MTGESRTCKVCNEAKPLHDFYRDRGRRLIAAAAYLLSRTNVLGAVEGGAQSPGER